MGRTTVFFFRMLTEPSNKNFAVDVFFLSCSSPFSCAIVVFSICRTKKIASGSPIPATRLPADPLFSVLSFCLALEIWDHRLISVLWHQAARVALSQVRTYDFGKDEPPSHIVRQVVGMCRNLVEVRGGLKQVTKIL